METEVRTFNIHGGWGHHVEWLKGLDGGINRRNDGEMEVWGHLPTPPVVGDRVTSNMESGRVGVYEVTEVERPTDPPDMFFAWVKPLGYEDELADGSDDGT